MIKIAVTGNIASGKSAVQKIIESMGYPVLDTDKCAHRALFQNTDVINFFGTNKRSELAKIVFNDKSKLKKLESILHPLIRDDILYFFKSNQHKNAVFVAVPQLFEAGFDDMFDKIIFVSAPYDLRLKRLIKRNNFDENYARVRLDSQLDEKFKIPKCDCVIENNSTLEALECRTKECLKLLL